MSDPNPETSITEPSASDTTSHPPRSTARKVAGWIGGLFLLGMAAVIAGFAILGVALAMAFPNLPEVADLADYRPKLPLRILTAEGELMGEFGEERRDFLRIDQIPKVMKDAVLAIEDARFFQHSGVDYRGMARAALANLKQVRSQGASTITMQVARNVYLTADKTLTRKIYEVLLTFKLEHELSKEQILEIYMNQIFLGQRSYGFSMAARTYFGKELKDITIAEAAMLAGLPKAPSAYNPVSNPRRARIRQVHIIDRMLENGFITAEEARQAKAETPRLRPPRQAPVKAEHATEMVRMAMLAQYGEEAYTRGLRVTTTVRSKDQQAAYAAVRKGLLDYERRQAYRGPEKTIALPADKAARDDAILEVLSEHPDSEELLSAVVLDAGPKKVTVVRQDGEPIVIAGEGLRSVQSALQAKAAPTQAIRAGAVVRIVQNSDKSWQITQMPEVESALVSLDTQRGAIRALVGGFDYNRGQFNRVTQAWRQPGSSFKPFVYSAAVEKGLSPMTIVNDTQLTFSGSVTGDKVWQPKNYDGQFEGPMSVRRALAKSKNSVSIQVLQLAGVNFAQEWVTHFGFEARNHPPYLTMALGAGSVTPLEMAQGYAVFATGGLQITPYLIERITDNAGKVLYEAPKATADESKRVIPERNAFITNSLLQEITRSGTAARAQATLKRTDLYGKTGTTNDAVDAWFVGFHPSLVVATWVGYDKPRNLGSRETGGGLSLPIWIQYMQTALQGVPEMEYRVPPGVISAGGDWYYQEFGPGNGVRSLGVARSADENTEGAPAPEPTSASESEKSNILEMFRE
jgi:penicillin-binding protein 1A